MKLSKNSKSEKFKIHNGILYCNRKDWKRLRKHLSEDVLSSVLDSLKVKKICLKTKSLQASNKEEGQGTHGVPPSRKK